MNRHLLLAAGLLTSSSIALALAAQGPESPAPATKPATKTSAPTKQAQTKTPRTTPKPDAIQDAQHPTRAESKRPEQQLSEHDRSSRFSAP